MFAIWMLSNNKPWLEYQTKSPLTEKKLGIQAMALSFDPYFKVCQPNASVIDFWVF